MARAEQPVSPYLKRPRSLVARSAARSLSALHRVHSLGTDSYPLFVCCFTHITLARATLADALPQATLLGSKVWVFAGEDAGRKALGDVHVLDLDSLTWSSPEVGVAAAQGTLGCRGDNGARGAWMRHLATGPELQIDSNAVF